MRVNVHPRSTIHENSTCPWENNLPLVQSQAGESLIDSASAGRQDHSSKPPTRDGSGRRQPYKPGAAESQLVFAARRSPPPFRIPHPKITADGGGNR